ncbi:MAG: DUF1566 domain-containing protein [Magnetococcales bacterium]|nr:DUF1566 domain-containing protein [Magnetococcales bacterium]
MIAYRIKCGRNSWVDGQRGPMMKKMLLPLFIILGFSSQTYALTILGDVAPLGNPNGEITIGDAVVAARMAVGLITPDLNADVAPLGSPNGQITIGDAVVLARAAVGLVTLPVLQTSSNALSDYISERYQQTINNVSATTTSVPATSTSETAIPTTTFVPATIETAFSTTTSVPATSTVESTSSTTSVPVTSITESADATTALEMPHFTDNNDGTFTDNTTGLLWLTRVDCLEESTLDNVGGTISTIIHYGSSCGVNSIINWRLPTLAELKTMLLHGNTCPAVATDNPARTHVRCGCYWTSSDAPFYNDSIAVGSSGIVHFAIERKWGVCFQDGEVRDLSTKARLGTSSPLRDYKYNIWPVYGKINK